MQPCELEGALVKWLLLNPGEVGIGVDRLQHLFYMGDGERRELFDPNDLHARAGCILF